ncbi:MAG TPA: OmpA family protein [Candidatus Polarisedimenticolia bacterium]|nr:OmpA family protein [Candidatus Polarisedimenticolia bacterium]
MSSQSRRHRGLLAVMLLAPVAFLCSSSTLAAQDQPAPKWELFGGYSVFQPGADVHGVLPGGILPVSSRLEINPRGAGASLTYDFNRWLGITLDGSTHWGDGENGVIKRIDDTGFSNLSLGPKFTFRHRLVSPFLEVLVGDQRLMPAAFHNIDKLGFMAGGGLDINLSRHFALRPIRADYVYSNYRYGPSASTSATQIRGVRLQAGFNFMFGGGTAPVPPGAACSVEPAEVFAGEAVTVRTSGTGFNPKRTIKYNWSGAAVKVAGTDASSQVDTTGLQPGPYQMTANLNDGTKNGVASCSATFTVKQPRPPQISCLSDPRTINLGGTATIQAKASSPDSRRLTYSYRATAGDISGTDATATLNASGAQPGPITVTCTVSDDRSPALTASAMTTVAVEAPPPEPPAEIKQLEIKLSLHSIYFQTARPTEKNPGGGLMESQEAVLATLAIGFNRYLTFKPEAHLILGGHADLRGSDEFNKRLTERRVERAKSFLVEHGVPAGSIEVRSFGKEDNLTANQVKQQIHENPDLTEDDRQKMLNNLSVLVLANNRRVDISLSTTGQQSLHRYPFNAKDALGLISEKGVDKQPSKKKPVRK